MGVNWERRHEAFKAIHDAITSGIAQVRAEGKVVTKKVYSYNEDDNLETVEYYDGDELLFTLTYTYDPTTKNFKDVVRS